MVTKTNTAPALPSWDDTEDLAGVSVTDKDELVGKPFRVTAVKQTYAVAGYPQVWVEVDFPDGTAAQFMDSSATQGVRAEVEEILNNTGKVAELDEWVPLVFKCPQGLRVSRYEKEDQRGKLQPSRSYYFTRSGVRA